LKYFYFLLAIVLVSCKTNSNNSKSVWTFKEYKATTNQILPLKYTCYTLNKKAFDKQLIAGKINLPLADNTFAYFQVENSQTMSEALQDKFPQLKSYKGVQENNTLCKCRVDQNNLDFTITIFCNDATYYISDLYKNNNYFFYNKKDLPNGVGQINE